MKFFSATLFAVAIAFFGQVASAGLTPELPIFSAPEDVPPQINVNLEMTRFGTQILVLRLPAVFGTGSDWRVLEFKDGEVKLSQQDLPQTVEITGPMAPTFGRTELEVLTFPALPAGEHQFTLVYGRPWDSKPARTVSLTVNVIPEN